ncbi:hypothetical protein [Hyalangium rubrum]|uniref:DUF2059 domain-containing protein n=1 Tax=Hyalangium rubrum TaxID=3103134 RepID=A0ABU5HIC4_9BACT|nr:hypothetical protein [Hyalangium sp. s54d21]MDY7233223.1 hypothetical protein [Hyalangium sp. s54d21]
MTMRLLAATCLCLLASFAHAQEAAADPDAVVREILELSGARKQIEQLVANSQSEIGDARGQLKPKEQKQFQASMQRVFQTEPLYQALFAHHRGAYDAKKSAAVLEWLRTPLARKAVELEVRALSVKERPALRKYAQQIQSKPPPAARQAILERLQEASRVMEFNRRMVSVMLRSVVSAFNAAAPPEKRLPPGKLDEVITRGQEQIGPTLRQSVRAIVLYTYRDLPDADVRAYTQFLESDLGRWYVQVNMDANVSAIEQASTKLGQELSQIMEQKVTETKAKKKKKR